MIEIRRIELREILVPLVRPFRTAGGTVSSRRVLLLESLTLMGFDSAHGELEQVRATKLS